MARQILIANTNKSRQPEDPVTVDSIGASMQDVHQSDIVLIIDNDNNIVCVKNRETRPESVVILDRRRKD